jgi:hypothetical protein
MHNSQLQVERTPLTIDTHHHMLPDFFWRETDNAHAPVGGLAPLRWFIAGACRALR